MKKGAEHVTLATASRLETIERHWRYILDVLAPQVIQVNEHGGPGEFSQFIESRGSWITSLPNIVYLINTIMMGCVAFAVTALASLEEGDEAKDEARVAEFHANFPHLSEDKVVTCTC